MSTAGGNKRAPGTPSRSPVYVGQTFRMLKLQAGLRPFAVVKVNTEADTASGWLFPDPDADMADPLLKSLGIQAAARRQACYITVGTDLLK